MARKKTYKQGLYVPTNPEKYIGDVNDIVFRSSWELEFNKYVDNNVNVLHWASEPFPIPYIKPTDGRRHKYYVDYFVEYINRLGHTVTELVEIKPLNQVSQPKKTPRKKQAVYLNECATYSVNCAKWHAAKQYAQYKGWTFRIITERELFNY